MKSKKAQGITFNVIIVAAVAVIVLIVLIAIFTGKIGKVGKDLDTTTKESTCEGKDGLDGTCKAFCASGETEVLTKTECMDNPVKIHCCKE